MRQDRRRTARAHRHHEHPDTWSAPRQTVTLETDLDAGAVCSGMLLQSTFLHVCQVCSASRRWVPEGVRSRYRGTIEIDTGRITGVAGMVARGIFRHHERRWRAFARTLAPRAD